MEEDCYFFSSFSNNQPDRRTLYFYIKKKANFSAHRIGNNIDSFPHPAFK
jgi:hypothetical protein